MLIMPLDSTMTQIMTLDFCIRKCCACSNEFISPFSRSRLFSYLSQLFILQVHYTFVKGIPILKMPPAYSILIQVYIYVLY